MRYRFDCFSSTLLGVQLEVRLDIESYSKMIEE
jgi:hypothetical protein